MSARLDLPRGWTPKTRTFFRRVYGQLKGLQNQMLHPDTKALPREQWNTIAWNAAWIAAEYQQDATLRPSGFRAPTNAKVRKARAAGNKVA